MFSIIKKRIANDFFFLNKATGNCLSFKSENFNIYKVFLKGKP